jgi:UrcA family protein
MIRMATAAAACALAIPLALAQPVPEITVTSSRLVETVVGHEPGKVPVVRVSLGYTVNAAGLDLGTRAGVQDFERRVNDAAYAACKELGKLYPQSLPDDDQCARSAASEAMVKVHQLEAAATAAGKSGN